MSDKDAEEAVEFYRLSNDATSTMMSEAMEDLRFSIGENQWPAENIQSRQLENRPCLTVNKLDTYCRQVINQMRQQRPRIKVHAVNNIADPKIASVIQGLIRHIEVNSDADQAYDLACNFQVRIGFGYWRVLSEYVSDHSFDQEIRIRPIENPFSVSFDPNSSLPDGSDSEGALVSDLMPRKTFKLAYPGADDGSGWLESNTKTELYADWVKKEDVRIAEFFFINKKKDTLCLLSDGTILWSDQVKLAEKVMAQEKITVIGDRHSIRRTLKWRMQTGMEVLDERDLPGRWIPIIPVYGESMIIDGKRKHWGITKNAKDPQRMVNFWETSMTESIALAPKAKWVMAAGQDEGFENEWTQANVAAKPVLHYNQRDIKGEEAPAPSRIQPEPPPVGVMTALQNSTQNLREVIGMSDPAQRISGNVSGKALQAERQQSDQSNFHFYDNLTRSIRHTGKILLDWIPSRYDTQRVIRIIGEDERPKMMTINEKAVEKVLNDVTVGEYDVVMDTGPGYTSKRQEAVDVFTAMLDTPLGEKISQVADDIIVRNLDVPGADIIADRLAAANPLAQIDEMSDIPPGVQMKIKQMQKALQDSGQMIQSLQGEIKLKTGIEKARQDGATRRELIKATAAAHSTEETQASWRHEVETKAVTAHNIEEIKGVVQLLLAHVNRVGELEKLIKTQEVELDNKMSEDQGPQYQ